jgi:hypothetical protein
MLAAMRSEVIVAHNVLQQWASGVIVAQQSPLVMQVAYPRKKTRQTDRHGQAHKVFFAHPRK